ncbi:hypothetical protein LMG23994_05251 [Cupriavidus pinatubonensis]|uniref:Uncharacterized protein n=1 Tax=Cupriavidus pinatubonensis TaxID=248026 RepID=A0ABM8XU41_9BURK|nr:hypothetical protein LMG23994_05251 [Cupriavidus pinatubonensis]
MLYHGTNVPMRAEQTEEMKELVGQARLLAPANFCHPRDVHPSTSSRKSSSAIGPSRRDSSQSRNSYSLCSSLASRYLSIPPMSSGGQGLKPATQQGSRPVCCRSRRRSTSYLVSPPRVEVIHIDEAFVFAEMKRGQRQFVHHCAELQDALKSFAVTPTTNAELVQMFVGPAHDDLDDMVQLSERQVLRNEDAPPNRRAQAAQSNSKLKDGDRRPRIGSHARIVGASLASQ